MRKLLLILFNAIFFTMAANAALTVTATGTNGTCLANASITATASGNTGTVNYELLQGGTVIRSYQASGIFANLPAGTYMVQVQDASTSATSQSSTVTLMTTYVTMTVSAPSYEVGCASATTGQLTVSVSGGNSPFTYAITAGPVTYTAQSSNVFNNLPVGSYTIAVTDACGVISTITSSVYPTSTIAKDIQPPFGGAFFAWGNYQNGVYNKCSDGAFVNTYGWTYKSNNGNVTTFDLNHFYWRYQYPSGSGNIYGAGGVLNGPMVPLTTRSIPAPITASYPFGNGDIIIYDECGNSFTTPNSLWQSTATSTPQQGIGNWARPLFDCTNGGGVTILAQQYETICFPVTYTFTDNSTSTVTTEIINNNNQNVFYGFVPGHTYSVVALDALGHNATTTTSITIPTSVGNLAYANSAKSNSFVNSTVINVNYPVQIPANTAISYTVVASSSPSVSVGYTKSFTYSTVQQNSATFAGPNGDNSWPAGTYTVTVNSSPCIVNSSFTFTVPNGYNADFNNNNTITPVCGAFNVVLQAALDNSASYQVKIMSGPSNVGTIKGFNGTAVSSGIYNSLSFDGLAYGTYTFGLVVSGGSKALSTQTVTYSATSALIIEALTTGGYVCSGYPTGSLTVAATSASGSALQYSIDNGVTWQASNVFPSIAVGTYQVAVKDVCGNTATYNASVVQASGISASASPNPACIGSSVQLSVNAIGATSYAWTGPNGYTATVQNPVIPNVQLVNAGTYTVTVTSPSCTNVATADVVVNALPTATVSYPSGSFCATGTITPTITGTTGGTFSSTPGLSINSSTGAVNLASSAAGTYTVTYSFSNAVTGCSNTTTTSVTVNALPLVVTHSQSNCAPGTVNLTAAAVTSGSTTGLTYTYYTDAAGTVTLSNPATVATSGTYYIKGYLASTGCYSALTPVTVTINPQPTVIITNPAAVCEPGTVDITVAAITAGSSANLAYAYYTNAAGTTVLSKPGAIAASGTYYIQGTNTITGCASAVMPVTVTVTALPPTPTASVTTQPNCTISTGTITVTAPVGAGYTYSVDGTNYQPGATFRGLATGSYNVTVKNSVGCTSAETALTINAQPVTPASATASVTAQPTCALATGTITVTAPVGAGYTYSVDGTTYQSETTFSGLATGSYNVTVKNSVGCTSAATALTINAQPVTPASATASVSAQPTCALATGTITVTAPVGAGYTYSVDGINYQSGTTFSGLATGSYNVTVKNSDGCTSVSTPLTINSQPATPIVNINPASSMCANSPSVQLVGTPGGGTFSGAGVSPGGVFSPATAGVGSHLINYSYTNSAGCTAVATITIDVLAAPALTINPASQTICAGSSASMAVVGDNGGTVTWSSNYFGLTGAGTSFDTGVLTNSGTASYILNLTATAVAGSCQGRAVATVTVLPEPRVILVPESTTICSYEKLHVTLSSVIVGTSVSWIIVDNSNSQTVASGSGLDNVLITNKLPSGSYTIKATGTKDGCTSGVTNVPVVVS